MFNKVLELARATQGARWQLASLGALAVFALAAQAQQAEASELTANPGIPSALDLEHPLSESFDAPNFTPPQGSTARVPAAVLDQANRMVAAGDRRGASQLLWPAVRVAPDDADALALLGRTELQQVHCTALAQVQHAAALRPADPFLGVLLAGSLTTCGDPVEAARLVDVWIDDAQTPPTARAEALSWRALTEVERGGDALKSAEEDARAALQADDHIQLPWQALFHVHLRQDKPEDARADIDQLAVAGAPPQDVALFHGLLAVHLKHYDEAELELSHTLTIEPGHLIALLSRSRERRFRADLDGALRDARELVANESNNADYWDTLMRVQFARDDFAGARDAVDQKLRLQPEDAGFLAERAELDGALGDYEGAVADYDRSLALNADDADAWIDRATPLWRLDRGSDAVASCLKGLSLSDTPRHRSTCTVVEWQAGDHPRAVETLDRVLARKEGIEVIGSDYWRNNLGMEMLTYGRMKEAATWLKSLQNGQSWTYGAVFLYVARALSGEEPAARAELAAWPKSPELRWQDHLVDYAVRRIDDDALVRLSTTGDERDLPGQACEATFYRGLRHWIDGDIDGGRALLGSAAGTCPRTFGETRIARGWLVAGPGADSGSYLPAPTR